MAKIGLGIVGLSAKRGWASQSHAPALAKLSQDFEIRGLTASTVESAKEAAAKFAVPFYSDDAAALAARPEIDLVVVCVKVIRHRQPVDAALNAGKHVLCEWPLGVSAQDAGSMADLARAKGVRGFVGLQARFQPGLHYIRDLLADGYVGEVLSTSVIAQGGGSPRGGGPVPQAMTFYLGRENGAGMLNIPMGHTLDGMCWLFGELGAVKATLATRRPSATITETGAPIAVSTADQVAVSGVFANGAVASIHYRTAISGGATFHWEINGDKGSLIITAPNGHLQLAPLKVQGTRAGAAPEDLPIPTQYAFADLDPTLPSSAVGRLYSALAADLRTGSLQVASFDAALRRHRMIESIERAAGVALS